jgi:hypothetical protein
MKTSLEIMLDDHARLLQENKKLKDTIRFLERELDKERAVNRGVYESPIDKAKIADTILLYETE